MTPTALENDLRVMGHRLLTESKRELEQSGRLTPVFVVQEKGGEFRRFELFDKLSELMNWGDAKDALFGFVRHYVQAQEATGCVFVSEAWITRSTPEGETLGPGEFVRRYREIGAEKLIERGLAERVEAILVTAHSADSVTTLTQPFERHQRPRLVAFGTLDVQRLPQSNFAGRQKMFGDLREENLR